jgi:hypothetical protein
MRRQGSGAVVLGLVIGLFWVVGCGAEPSATGTGAVATATSTSTAAVVAPAAGGPALRADAFGSGGHPGVRFDLRDRIEHVRALQKQPDGTYKSVCVDGAQALRPAAPHPDGEAGVRR